MVLLFVATRAAGDPATLNLPADATPEQIQLFRERIGTDKSYLDQFGVFVRDMATFNFGRSVVYNQPVTQLIGSRLIATSEAAIRLASPDPGDSFSARRTGGDAARALGRTISCGSLQPSASPRRPSGSA